MKLRFNHVALVGTTREIDFEPGLNIITGPISTGKTSLMKLLEVLLGASYHGVSPEVDSSVRDLAANLTIGESDYAIVRPLVQTDTARVQIAGTEVAERLPAMRLDPTSEITYGSWLLKTLGLPLLRVPQAPTRPAESAFIPVSISDYLAYCRLRQDEIDVDVLGSSHPFRDIKRRYVFGILYGRYDAEIAGLQEKLRSVQSEITQLKGGRGAFQRFLAGTALDDRGALERELLDAKARMDVLSHERDLLASPDVTTSEALRLRSEIGTIERRTADIQAELERERRSIEQLDELGNQLQARSIRVTKAIVAGERFVDFEFVVCPRCGSSLDGRTVQHGNCYLCLQEEPPAPTREDLIHEQDRINAQAAETDELVRAHQSRAEELNDRLIYLFNHRGQLGRSLDQEVQHFISDHAEQLEMLAGESAALNERIQRLTDYIGLFDRFDKMASRIEDLDKERRSLEAALDRALQMDSMMRERIRVLEDSFEGMVNALQIPTFGHGPRAAIDLNDYQPILNGQKFPQLSAGVRVLVNIAHLLAHHRTALDTNVSLPGLMLMDGIAKNIGTLGYDAERIDNIWNELLRITDEFGDRIQIIVAASDAPIRAQQYVRLELSETDRLIP